MALTPYTGSLDEVYVAGQEPQKKKKNSISSAVLRGIDLVQANLAGAGAAQADTLNYPKVRNALEGVMQSNLQEAAANPYEGPNAHDAIASFKANGITQGVRDLTEYGVNALSERAAQAVSSMAAYAIGSKIGGKAGLKNAAGGMLGALANNSAQGTGSIYSDILEQTGQREGAKATGYGITEGLVDTAVEAIPLGKVFAGKTGAGNVVADVLKAGVKQMPADAGTEYVQKGIEQAAVASVDPEKRILTPENEMARREAAAAGAIVGGVTGSVAEAGGRARNAILGYDANGQPITEPAAPEPVTPEPVTPEPIAPQEPIAKAPATQSVLSGIQDIQDIKSNPIVAHIEQRQAEAESADPSAGVISRSVSIGAKTGAVAEKAAESATQEAVQQTEKKPEESNPGLGELLNDLHYIVQSQGGVPGRLNTRVIAEQYGITKEEVDKAVIDYESRNRKPTNETLQTADQDQQESQQASPLTKGLQQAGVAAQAASPVANDGRPAASTEEVDIGRQSGSADFTNGSPRQIPQHLADADPSIKRAWYHGWDMANSAKPVQKEAPEANGDMQNRDRSRAASVAQMAGIANNPDFDRLSESKTPESGAPMAYMLGDQIDTLPAVGRDDVVVFEDGQKVPVKYAVVEAGTLQASHDASGKANPAYAADLQPGQLRALNNGRTAGLQAAYDNLSADEYRANLTAQADRIGVDPAVIASMDAPVLVRLYSEKDNTPNMGARSNASAGLGLSPSEQANTDASLLGNLDDIRLTEDGEFNPASNMPLIQRFMRQLPATEAGKLTARDGTPTEDLSRRLKNAILSMAYKDANLVETATESAESRNLMQALNIAAPRMATLPEDDDIGLRQLVSRSAHMLRKAKQEGTSVQQVGAQMDITGGYSPEEEALATFMEENNRTPRKLGEVLALLADYAHNAHSSRNSMFGDDLPATKQAAFAYANEKLKGANGNDAKQIRNEGQQEAGTQRTGESQAQGANEGGAGRADGRSDGERQEGRPQAELTPSAGFALESYTNDEIAAKEAAAQAKTDKEAQVKKDAENKAKADAEVGQFVLTGSDRVSDVAAAAGQNDMFGASSSRPKTNSDEISSSPQTSLPAVSENKVFTEDAAAAARERLRKALGGSQLNSGIDPQVMLDGITLAGYHIEKGARTFSAYSKAMIEALGENVRPYLKSWYMGVKYDPRAAQFEGMSSAAEVEAYTETQAPEPAKSSQGETLDLLAPAPDKNKDLVEPWLPILADLNNIVDRFEKLKSPVKGLIEKRAIILRDGIKDAVETGKDLLEMPPIDDASKFVENARTQVEKQEAAKVRQAELQPELDRKRNEKTERLRKEGDLASPATADELIAKYNFSREGISYAEKLGVDFKPALEKEFEDIRQIYNKHDVFDITDTHRLPVGVAKHGEISGGWARYFEDMAAIEKQDGRTNMLKSMGRVAVFEQEHMASMRGREAFDAEGEIRTSDEPNIQAARDLLDKYKKAVGNKLAEGKIRKEMLALASKTDLAEHPATVMALDMLATRLGYDGDMGWKESQKPTEAEIQEPVNAGAATELDVSDITADTYKQWKKAVEHLGKVNGWDLFKDDINNAYSLMTPFSHARPFSTEEAARSWAGDNKANPLGYFKKDASESSKDSSNPSNSEEQKTKELSKDEQKAKDWAMSLIGKLKGNDPVLVDGNSKTWKLSMDLPAWLRGANVKSLWASAHVTSGQTETKLSWTLENSDTEYKQLLIGTSSLKGNSRITVQYTELAEARAASESEAKESNGSDFDPAAFIKIAADSIDKLRQQDVDRVLADAYALGEDQLGSVTQYIMDNNAKLMPQVTEFFEEVAGFLEDTKDKRIKHFVDVGLRRRNASDLRESIAKNFGEDLAGLQLQGASDRYAFFLPDASNAGKFRVTYFDKNGLSGHTTYDTYAKALDEAIQDGYKTEAPGSLEKLSELDSFKAGNEWAHKLQAFHDGKITWADFVAGKDANEKQAEAKDPLGVSEERELSDYIASDYRNASNSTAIAGTGWVMHDDSINSAGTIQLVSASRNVIRDIKYDPKSGTDHRRAIVKATVWAQENQDKFEAPKGELVSKPVFTASRNEFTVERFDRDADENKTERFERGEYVRAMISKDKSAFGEIDGISQARNEASVDGLWYGFGSIYKAERPAKPEENKVPLGDVIDSVNKKHGEGLTDDDKVKAPSKTPSVDRHNDVISAVNAGKSTPEEFKASFNAVVDNADAIKAELATKTKAELLSSGGGFIRSRYASETKPRIIDAIYRQMLGDYVLGSSLTYGMGKGAYEAAVRQQVEATDADSLAAYAAELVKRNEESDAKRASTMAGIEDPKTLEDFRNVVRSHMANGKKFTEARLMMTPEQRAEYDRLEAETTRESRLARKRATKTEVKAAGQTVGGEIIATKHTKKGHDLFAVQLAERVSKDDYSTLNAAAKRLGGYYSSFRANGAIPGFQFTDKANAEAFLQLAAGDTTAAKEAAVQRRDAFDDDRSQSAAERLNEMADRLEGRADDVLNADRKTNTSRRAAMAARAEGAANADKALAQTMRNLAKAIEAGKAEFLDAVRQKTQVEMLEAMVKRAKDNEIRAKYPNYGDQQKHAGEKPGGETADHAEFPAFTAYRSDLASLARKMLEVEGTKKIGKQLMSVADDVSDAYLKFAKENLDRVSQFGRGDKLADFGSRDDAEKAIKRSGLVGKAIVLPVKRGQNRIVLSPSEAINREIWTGDGDKRITLSKAFGMEMVQAIGRRGSRLNGLAVPWQLETAADRLKALDRIGIETPAEFRSALREFIALREQAAEPDKIKEMERAMIGRKNDGLDFFPTPEGAADSMIEAADLKEGMTVLEPSAGMGHIAERIRAAGVEPDVIEMASNRKDLLEAKGFSVIGRDFMEIKPREFFTYGDVFRNKDGVLGVMRGSGGLGSNRVGFDPLDDNGEPDMRRSMWENRDDLEGVRHRGTQSGYDRIIMNPPFSDRRDAEHVRHAYELLRPGGRIVAIMGEGVFYGSDKKAQAFRDWLESVGGTDEKLAEGTFLDPSLPVNTGVNARMVVIDKAEGGEMHRRTEPVMGGKTITREKAQEIVDRFVGQYKGAASLGFTLYDTKEQAYGTDSLKRQKLENAVLKGAYKQGRIHLILADHKDEADLLDTIRHEAWAHFGFDLVDARQKAGILKSVKADIESNGSLAAIMDNVKRNYRAEDGSLPSEAQLLEEVVARIAEKYGNQIESRSMESGLRAAVRNILETIMNALRFVGLARFIRKDDGIKMAVQFLTGSARMQRGELTSRYDNSKVSLASQKGDGKWYYSALKEAAADMKQEKGTPEQMLAMLSRVPGVKPAEIEATGLPEYLSMQGKSVTKQQIMDYLQGNGVQVQETMLGDGKEPVLPDGWTVKYEREQDAWVVYDEDGEEVADGTSREDAIEMAMDDDARSDNPDLAGKPKFGQHVLPGGKNYRELLLTLPSKIDAATKRLEELQVLAHDAEQDGNKELANQYHREAERISSENDGKTVGSSPDFRSSHFAQQNILAHVRFNERTDAEGKKVLFIEEIQSDWAQAGRKEGFRREIDDSAYDPGFGRNVTIASRLQQAKEIEENLPALRAEAEKFMRGIYKGLGVEIEKNERAQSTLADETKWPSFQQNMVTDRESPIAKYLSSVGLAKMWRKEADGIRSARQKEQESLAPSAPFVTSTDAWVGLAMKRMIAYAAENGFDRVAWTTGEQQADRYSLSKTVDVINIQRRVDNATGETDKVVHINVMTGSNISVAIDDNGVITESLKNAGDLVGKNLAEVIGKDITKEIVSSDVSRGENSISGDGLNIGGDGMKSFYNNIVPKVAKEVTKKMGGKVDEATFFAPIDIRGEDFDALGFNITKKMRDAVEGGLPLFRQDGSSLVQAEESPLYKNRTAEQAGAVSKAKADEALKVDATAQKILAKGNTIKAGDLVGVRLNINVLNRTGVPVQSIHKGGEGIRKKQAAPGNQSGFYNGEVLTYLPVATLKNAYFTVHQPMRDKIASGASSKTPMASADGEWISTDSPSFDGVLARFNPHGEHLFIDQKGRAVKWAEEATIMGHRAYLRGKIEYYQQGEAPAKTGDAPTKATFYDPGQPPEQLDDLFFRRAASADQIAKAVKGELRGRLTDAKPALLGAIPLNYLKDYARNGITAVSDYIDTKRQMDKDRDTLHAQYDKHAQDWFKWHVMHSDESHKLMDLMHASTIAGVDPSKPLTSTMLDMINGIDEKASKRQEYDKLRARYDALPQKARELYNTIRDDYSEQRQLLDKTIIENISKAAMFAEARAEREYRRAVESIQDDGLTEQEEKESIALASTIRDRKIKAAKAGSFSRVQMLRKVFESNSVESPYFPLFREGDYFAAVYNGKNIREVQHFTKAADQSAFVEEQQAAGYRVKFGRKSNKQDIAGAMDPRFIADIDEVLADLPDADDVRDQIYQRYLESLPDMSVRKSFIHRKKTPGFMRDAMKAYASRMFHGSYQIARMKYTMDLQDSIERAEEQAQHSNDPVNGMALVNELRLRHEWVLNPANSAASQWATTAAFVYYLGASPAQLFLNASQTIMMGIPILGSRYGMAKASTALMGASREFFGSRGKILDALQGNEKRAMQEFYKMGLIDRTQTFDLAGIGENGSGYSAARTIVMGKIGMFFQSAEVFNREVTSLASYRLAVEAGVPHETAVKEAAEKTWQAHFDYTSGNRARYMQNDWARVFLVFRQYSVNMLYRLFRDTRDAFAGETPQIKKEARYQLGGLMGMYGLMAGVTGMPLYGIAMALGKMFDEEDEDFEQEFKIGVMNMLGETAGAVVLNGVPGTATNTDLSSRIGMGNLWFRDLDAQLEGKDAYWAMIEQVLGAVPGIGANVAKGISLALDGNVERGIEAMMPTFVRGAMRGVRYATEGEASTMSGQKMAETTGWDAIAQAMGFTPAHIAERYETNAAIRNAEGRIRERRQKLLNEYVVTLKAGGDKAEPWAAIREFNLKYPALAITPKSIRASIKTRARRDQQTESGLHTERKMMGLRERLELRRAEEQ